MIGWKHSHVVLPDHEKYTNSATLDSCLPDSRNIYMVREHHVAVLQVNHVSVLCMGLTTHHLHDWPEAQPRGALGPCKYFFPDSTGTGLNRLVVIIIRIKY